MFERFGIDYCCGGKTPLGMACADRGLDVGEVIAALEEPREAEDDDVDWTAAGGFAFGSVENPIRAMMHEHDEVAARLERLRDLTGGFAPPTGACNSYRAMLDRLHTLETDTHRHVHEENNVLFPRAVALEAAAQ